MQKNKLKKYKLNYQLTYFILDNKRSRIRNFET